jgi:hypothetical protein
LEAQAETERASIFEEKSMGLFDMFGESGLKQFDLGTVVVGAVAVGAIAGNAIAGNAMALKKIALAVRRHRHWRPLLIF